MANGLIGPVEGRIVAGLIQNGARLTLSLASHGDRTASPCGTLT